MNVTLVGGPLCGKQKPLSRQPGKFLWAQATSDEADAPVRFFRLPSDTRHLYRAKKGWASDDKCSYLYAGHSYAYCCDTFHQKDDKQVACIVCGEPLHFER